MFFYDFQFELVFLSDQSDLVVEVGASRVDLVEEGNEDSQGEEKEQTISADDQRDGSEVVDSLLSDWVVEVDEDYEHVLSEEEEAADGFGVVFYWLLEGTNGNDEEDVDELEQEDEKGKDSLPLEKKNND